LVCWVFFASSAFFAIPPNARYERPLLERPSLSGRREGGGGFFRLPLERQAKHRQLSLNLLEGRFAQVAAVEQVLLSALDQILQSVDSRAEEAVYDSAGKADFIDRDEEMLRAGCGSFEHESKGYLSQIIVSRCGSGRTKVGIFPNCAIFAGLYRHRKCRNFSPSAVLILGSVTTLTRPMPEIPTNESERLKREQEALRARSEQIESELRQLNSQIKKVTGRITLPPYPADKPKPKFPRAQ
jgi:hypothetical protein